MSLLNIIKSDCENSDPANVSSETPMPPPINEGGKASPSSEYCCSLMGHKPYELLLLIENALSSYSRPDPHPSDSVIETINSFDALARIIPKLAMACLAVSNPEAASMLESMRGNEDSSIGSYICLSTFSVARKVAISILETLSDSEVIRSNKRSDVLQCRTKVVSTVMSLIKDTFEVCGHLSTLSSIASVQLMPILISSVYRSPPCSENLGSLKVVDSLTVNGKSLETVLDEEAEEHTLDSMCNVLACFHAFFDASAFETADQTIQKSLQSMCNGQIQWQRNLLIFVITLGAADLPLLLNEFGLILSNLPQRFADTLAFERYVTTAINLLDALAEIACKVAALGLNNSQDVDVSPAYSAFDLLNRCLEGRLLPALAAKDMLGCMCQLTYKSLLKKHRAQILTSKKLPWGDNVGIDLPISQFPLLMASLLSCMNGSVKRLVTCSSLKSADCLRVDPSQDGPTRKGVFISCFFTSS